MVPTKLCWDLHVWNSAHHKMWKICLACLPLFVLNKTLKNTLTVENCLGLFVLNNTKQFSTVYCLVFVAQKYASKELLPMEVLLHCGNRDFRPFCSCDLDFDPMTFTYEPDPYSLEIYRMYEYELPTSTLSKVIVWQTYTHTHTDMNDWNYILSRFAGGQS